MTDPLAPRMRWWGWGVDGHDAPLPKAAAALLRDELGAGGARAARRSRSSASSCSRAWPA